MYRNIKGGKNPHFQTWLFILIHPNQNLCYVAYCDVIFDPNRYIKMFLEGFLNEIWFHLRENSKA